MISITGLTITTFLTNILTNILLNTKSHSILIICENSTIDLTNDLIATIKNHAVYVINEDVKNNLDNTSIPSQGLFGLFIVENIESISNIVLNYTAGDKFLHQNDNGLIILHNKYNTQENIDSILPNLFDVSVMNVGIIFWDNNVVEIFNCNPLDKNRMRFILKIKSDDLDRNIIETHYDDDNNSISIKTENIFDQIFEYKKGINLNGRNLSVLVGLDMGNVYEKINPQQMEYQTNIGGRDIYLVELIGELLNASFTYKLQDIQAIKGESDPWHLQYLNFVKRPVELPFDDTKPLNVIIIKTFEENGYKFTILHNMVNIFFFLFKFFNIQGSIQVGKYTISTILPKSS